MEDEEVFKKTCIREKKKRGDIHQPFYGTWAADFMLRLHAETGCRKVYAGEVSG